ncbi:MAG TPA: hypothetical protein VH062_24465 [Polyangiaceae bacterium]|jgi:hypothetical protein|nr:hypothetical protein [Polyangiaceae bacterium]
MRLFTKLLTTLAICSGAAASISACAGKDAPSVDQNQLQTELVHALCDSVQSCCTSAERQFDPVHCRTTVIQQFVVPLSDTTLIYDSVQAGRCIQAITAAAQSCSSVDISTCYDAFQGKFLVGAACQSSFECDQGPFGFAVCNASNVCEQPPRGTLGQPCTYTCIEGAGLPHCKSVFYGLASGDAAACHSGDGLVCVANAMGTATCEPLSADCKQNPTASCPAGQECNLTSGQCFVPVPVGQSCATALCGADGYCTGGICYPVKANAAVCVQDVECASGKCDRGFCVTFSQAAAEWCGDTSGAE